MEALQQRLLAAEVRRRAIACAPLHPALTRDGAQEPVEVPGEGRFDRAGAVARMAELSAELRAAREVAREARAQAEAARKLADEMARKVRDAALRCGAARRQRRADACCRNAQTDGLEAALAAARAQLTVAEQGVTSRDAERMCVRSSRRHAARAPHAPGGLAAAARRCGARRSRHGRSARARARWSGRRRRRRWPPALRTSACESWGRRWRRATRRTGSCGRP